MFIHRMAALEAKEAQARLEQVLSKSIERFEKFGFETPEKELQNFPDPTNELELHLDKLGIPKLFTRHLLWIPFDRFVTVTALGQGGFATVSFGNIDSPVF